ncbi:hypothetical protein BC936DRAFT_149921 [Jimgerdemannia flammicorona]|uniref:Uncharacterized protein n=1 Tax=Jimgerdemannia flammicorona TaxID=994334 RepID=A0A433CZU3_9FUNG|nr:hypothetical protein BC936DRAFT_149921 [Jimgerdemannia flammicorona]
MSLSFTDPQPILGPATANLYTKYVRITDETELRAHILRVRAILDNVYTCTIGTLYGVTHLTFAHTHTLCPYRTHVTIAASKSSGSRNPAS